MRRDEDELESASGHERRADQQDAGEHLGVADMVADLSDRIIELDAVAWNLPRPAPQPLPPDEVWPSAGDGA